MMRSEDQMVLELADMLRRDGHRMYGTCAAGCAYQASLCGLTAVYDRAGEIMGMRAADLVMEIALGCAPTDENDGVVRLKSEKRTVKATYRLGDAATLDAWHRHLCAYSRSMRTAHTAAA